MFIVADLVSLKGTLKCSIMWTRCLIVIALAMDREKYEVAGQEGRFNEEMYMGLTMLCRGTSK